MNKNTKQAARRRVLKTLSAIGAAAAVWTPPAVAPLVLSACGGGGSSGGGGGPATPRNTTPSPNPGDGGPSILQQTTTTAAPTAITEPDTTAAPPAATTTTDAPRPALPDYPPPGQPTELRATAVSPTRINLSWRRPYGGGPITHYEISYGRPGRGHSRLNTRSTATTYQLTGLRPGTRYSISVVAANVNRRGTGGRFSRSVNLVTPESAIRPGPPTGLMATDVGYKHDGSRGTRGPYVDFSWTAPVNDGGSPITHYSIRLYRSGGSSFTRDTSSPVTTHRAEQLGSETTYFCWVSAVNAKGTSRESDRITVTTLSDDPDPPTGLRATAVSSNQVNLSWTAPVYVGIGITHYEILVRVGTGDFKTLVSDTGSTATAYVVRLRENYCCRGRRHYYSVRAREGRGGSKHSSSNSRPASVVIPRE